MVYLSVGSVAPAYMISVAMTGISVLLGFFSSSVFMMWLSMELSVCSFCGVLSFVEMKSGEMIAKYFVVSAFSGVGILCSLLLDWTGTLAVLDESMVSWIFFMCVYAKLGLPPFHFWVVGVLWGCTWFSAFLLLTVQKVLPFLLMGSSVGLSNSLISFILVSSLAAGLGGLNHYEPYYLIGYSSMITGNWLVLVSFFSLNTFLLSLGLYSFGVFLVFFSIREKSWGVGFGQCNPWLLMAIMLVVGLPNGPVFMMKVLIYHSLLGCSCLGGAWVVAFTSILLVPLYLRLLVLVVMGVWGRGLNELFSDKWAMLAVSLSVMVFIFSGAGWSVLLV
nr:NADH dehydrogenase subunit 2 [Hydroides norvegica]